MRIVVISPHRDDACFSTALSLLQWSRARCSVLVVNCFTLSTYAPLSDADHTLSNDRITSISALRRREDETFARRVGSLEMRELGLEDAPERLKCGLHEICTRTLQQSDTALPEIRRGVIQEQKQWRPDAILIPLALGDHVDHLATREAVMVDACAGACAFYEDLPYAARPEVTNGIERVAAAIGERCGEALSPVLAGEPDDVTTKRALATLYDSQINGAAADEIANFATRYGGHERLWTNAAWRAIFSEQVSGQCPGDTGQ